jgi:hypothetical protein
LFVPFAFAWGGDIVVDQHMMNMEGSVDRAGTAVDDGIHSVVPWLG